MRRLALLSLMLLAACSPTDVADKVGRRAAETVVLPVVSKFLPGPQADAATRCIIDNASATDIQALARDIGVVAGSATIATVFRIAAHPNTTACLMQAGVPKLGAT